MKKLLLLSGLLLLLSCSSSEPEQLCECEYRFYEVTFNDTRFIRAEQLNDCIDASDYVANQEVFINANSFKILHCETR